MNKRMSLAVRKRMENIVEEKLVEMTGGMKGV